MSAVVDDQPARDAVAGELDATLFVEAGAGTGKTTAMVGRIVALVTTGRARLSEIAAITFTEAAAAELRDRVTEALERAAALEVDGSSSGPAHAAAALAEVDGAAILTLHAFARRVLSEHPFDAGLPPVIEVFDELRSTVAFDERWDGFVDRLLETPSLEQPVLRALACGVTLGHLRLLARQFDANWDLVLDAELGRPDLSPVERAGVLGPLRAARALAHWCHDPTDKMAERLAGLGDFVEDLAAADGEDEVLRLLVRAPSLAARVGRQERWHGHLSEVRAQLAAAQAARVELIARIANEAMGQLLVELRALTLAAAAERRRDGRLEYHDLLVQARQLVRDHPAVGAALGSRYRYLLIDEFQDTDPIQAELALRIASADPDAAGTPWTELTFEPGRVFFVGDPKQSIYRFRRADVGLFLWAGEREGSRAVTLSRNFRSVPGVLDWVNAVFSDLIGDGEPGLQPAFEPLAPVRPPLGGPGAGPPVVVLGGPVDDEASLAAIRAQEAAEIASAIRAARDEGWRVGEEGRPARLSDVTVLVPTRTGVPDLQRALDAADVPYRLEVSSLVYGSPEVRDLLTVLRAVDDPTDEVSVVAALRSALFGCGDDDLVDFRLAGGRWDYRQPPPGSLGTDHPVVLGQAALARLHGGRWWSDVSALVEEVLADRRQWELALDGPRPREAWRRLRFVADQARQFADAVGGDLRRYLAWTDLQAAEDARVTEVVLPEHDDDAVRIMTIHAAKGLEFPIVVLAGLNVPWSRRGGPEVLWGPDGPEVHLNQDIESPGFAALSSFERRAELSERRRLLYVAATRARDHLIVSLAHKAQGASNSHAALLDAACRAHPSLWRRLDPPVTPLGPVAAVTPPAADHVDDPATRSAWGDEHAERLAAALARPRVLAATAVAKLGRSDERGDVGSGTPDDPGLEKGEPGGELPAWRRGRAGTSVGRAVHAVLQAVDLATGSGLEALAVAHATAEGVADEAGEVARLVRAALESPTLRSLSTRRYWKELYVGAPVEGRVLEGFLDLLIEGPDGLQIVDYKTDRAATEGDLDQALDRYRLQGAAYAVAVEAAVGSPVAACTFLFLRRDGAVAREIEDLPAAMAEVRSRLAAA